MINQLKIAFRFFRNNGTFTLLNIIGLAFGFTCAIMILMHVGKENSYNKSIPDHERVFYLAQKSPDSPLGNTTISYALPVLLSEHFPEIEHFARTENYSQFSNCIVSYQPDGKNEIYSFNERSFCLADADFFQSFNILLSKAHVNPLSLMSTPLYYQKKRPRNISEESRLWAKH